MLFYREADLGLRAFFASGSADEQQLHKVAALLDYAGGPVQPGELADEMDLSETRLAGLVNLFEQAGAVEVGSDGTVAAVEDDLTPRQAADAAVEVATSHRKVEQSRLTMMRGYAETSGCRRQYLLAYFGEQRDEPCGYCDTCEAGNSREQAAVGQSPYPLQSGVVHAQWGKGLVMRYEGDRIVVLFDHVGYRTLSFPAVQSRGLLVPV